MLEFFWGEGGGVSEGRQCSGTFKKKSFKATGLDDPFSLEYSGSENNSNSFSSFIRTAQTILREHRSTS